MKIERVWAMPNKWTFTINPIKNLILEEYLGGPSVDPFAGTSKIATYRNDINPERGTEFKMGALEFLKSMPDNKFIFGFFDPPYSPRQFKECYDMLKIKAPIEVFNAGYLAKCKNEMARIIRPNGRVLCCDWNSNGMGKKRGFELYRILLVCHGSGHNDTIVTVE